MASDITHTIELLSRVVISCMHIKCVLASGACRINSGLSHAQITSNKRTGIYLMRPSAHAASQGKETRWCVRQTSVGARAAIPPSFEQTGCQLGDMNGLDLPEFSETGRRKIRYSGLVVI